MKATITITIEGIENYGDFENSTIPEMEQVVKEQIRDGDIACDDSSIKVIID